MKVSVKYSINPPLSISRGVKLSTSHAEILLDEIGGFAREIRVTISDATGELAPKITPDPKSGVKAHIEIPSEVHSRTLQIARTYVATLGLLGFQSRLSAFPISCDWEQEEGDESPPTISQFNVLRSRKEDLKPVGVDQLIHAAASLTRMLQWTDILEFNNTGHDNFLAERYAESLRYHFFVIESLYGNGRSNPYQLVQEFLRHRRVVLSTRSSIRCPQLYVTGTQDRTEYRLNFPTEDAKCVLTRLTLARGRISHHNYRSPHKWTVVNQVHLKPEATLAANIAHRLVWKLARTEMWSPEVVAACGGIRD